jgi:hypothetical protein
MKLSLEKCLLSTRSYDTFARLTDARANPHGQTFRARLFVVFSTCIVFLLAWFV